MTLSKAERELRALRRKGGILLDQVKLDGKLVPVSIADLDVIPRRICKACGKDLPITDFYGTNRGGAHSRCKICHNIHAKAYRQMNNKTNGGPGTHRNGSVTGMAVYTLLMFHLRNEPEFIYDALNRTVTIKSMMKVLIELLGRDIRSPGKAMRSFKEGLNWLRSLGILDSAVFQKKPTMYVRYLPDDLDPTKLSCLQSADYVIILAFRNDNFSLRLGR
jgi:hypothetical protein